MFRSLCAVATFQPASPPTNQQNDFNEDIEHLPTNGRAAASLGSNTNASSDCIDNEVKGNCASENARSRLLQKLFKFSAPKPFVKDHKALNSLISNNLNDPIKNDVQPGTSQLPKKARFLYSDLKQKPFTNFKFKAKLLAGNIEDKTFALVEVSNKLLLSTVQSLVGNKIEKLVDINAAESHEPVKDEVVLSRFEGTFYRGVCKEVQKDGFLIFYVDFGNIEIVQKEDIVKITEEFLEIEVVVHECYLENFPEKMTQAVAEILGNENGVEIIDARKEKNGITYIARIGGLL